MKKILTITTIFFIISCGVKKVITTNDLLAETNKLIKKEQWEKAEKNLTVLLKYHPDNAELYFQRGYVREMNFKYEKCISDFTKAISLKPEMHTARTNRGFAYRKLGKYSKAISDFTAELEVNPNPYSYEHRSFVYYLMGDYKKALKQVNISIKKDSLNSISYKTRALIYKEMDLKQKTCADKEKAIELKLLKKYPSYKTDILELNKYCHE